jgi:hypothetical protein
MVRAADKFLVGYAVEDYGVSETLSRDNSPPGSYFFHEIGCLLDF